MRDGKVSPYAEDAAARSYVERAVRWRTEASTAIRSRTRGVFARMRAEQLAELARVAQTGELPGRSYWSAQTPELTAGQRAALRSAGPLKAWSRATLAALPRLAAYQPDEVEGFALEQRATFSVREIDRLVIALDRVWRESMIDKLRQPYESVYAAASAAAASEIGAASGGELSSEVLDWLAAKRIKVVEGVNSTVARATRRALVRFFSGVEQSDLPTLIREHLEEVKKVVRGVYSAAHSRARVIALTETAQLANTARDGTFRTAGVERHRWLTSGRGPEASGGTVRESHWDLDRKVFRVGETIVTINGNALRYACDPAGAAEEIINCQCVMVPEDGADGGS